MSASSNIFIVNNLGYSLALDLSENKPSLCILTTPNGHQFPIRSEDRKSQYRLTALFSSVISRLTEGFTKTLFPGRGSISVKDLDEQIENLKYVFCGLKAFMTRNSDIYTPEVLSFK